MRFDADYRMIIGGQLVESKAVIDVFNPATGEAFASAPRCTAAQLDDAVEDAQEAFPAWSNRPISERQQFLSAAADAIESKADELAALFTKEQGRPHAGAKQEILGAIHWLRVFATISPPHEVKELDGGASIETRYVPLGVICAISPWNFPVSLSLWKVAPALLAGNTMVLKPSPFTPLCILKIGELLRGILPAGVLNVISGDDGLGPQMTSHPGFAKISFTGSTATGKRVMETASRDLKRLTLELGGNDAAIVMPDVDIDAVATKIFFGAFFNSAQICVATKRLYVHEDIYDELRDRLVVIASSVKVGDGSEGDTVLGPIQNKRQYDRVRELVEDARQSQLSVIEASQVPDNGGYFIPVTIIDNPPEDSRVVQEEAFGPVLPLLKFRDTEDVLARVNDSEYGLAGAIWSRDTAKAVEMARRIETGTVWINQNLNLRPDTPFSGRKQSGFGVENGMEGLLEYMAPQAIYIEKAAS